MIAGIDGVAAVRWKEKHAACLPRFERLNDDEHACHYAKRFSTTTATAALTSSITPLGNMMVSDSTRIVTKARSTAVAGVPQQISQSGTFRRVSNLNVSAGHYNLDVAESLLIAKCDFRYEAARDVYRGWAVYLDKLRQSDDNRLLRAYREVCDVRQTNPDLVRGKHLGNFFSAHIDLHYIANGIRTYWSSTHFLDPNEMQIVIADLLSLNRDLRANEYLMGQASFVCPMAEAKMCDAARNTCERGITAAEQFPPIKECRVRNSLVTSGLPLRRL